MYPKQDTGRRGTALTISQQIVIYRPPAEVFDHLADVDHARVWFAAARLTSRRRAPAVRATVVDRDRYLAFRDESASVPTYGDFRLTEVRGGTKLDYEANLMLIGVWRLAAAYLRLTGPRLITERLRQVRAEIESAPVSVNA